MSDRESHRPYYIERIPLSSVAPRSLHGLALCAGAAGLELGVALALDHLGIGYRLVGAVERDAYAAACLVARMEDASLDRAPVWDDIATFDPEPWRGRVDLVTAGFPCQPFSSAGRRAGTSDERWLWPHIERAVHGVGPGIVFVENVPEIASERGGLGDVLGSLAGLGFDAEWEMLAAREVGATQLRKRFWLLAYRDDIRREGVGREQLPDDRLAPRGDHADGSRGAPLADPDRERWSAHLRDDDTRQPDTAGSVSTRRPEPDGARIFPPPPR